MMLFNNLFKLNTIKVQLLVIIICAFADNANTLSNDFVYDDSFQIVSNNRITNIKYLSDIFTHDATNADVSDVSNYYRPIMNIVYMCNYYVFSGLKPWGFHLVNVLFHIGVVIVAFLVFTEMLRDDKFASTKSFFSVPFISALIFAVIPINSEVIAWVACVPELSFTLFCLVSMYFHMKSLQSFDKQHLLSIAAFCIAIFSKETAVTILPLLVLYDLMFRPNGLNLRRSVVRYFPYALVIGLYVILRLNALGGMAPLSRHPELNKYELFLNIIPLFSQYIEKLLLPINLNAFYVLHPVHSITEIKFIFSFIVVVAFVTICFILFNKNKVAFMGLLIIAIPLLPVLYIRGLGENTFCDRYLYFPSIGFALLSGIYINYLSNINLFKKYIYGFLIIVLILYSIGTIRRNNVWHDNFSLWTDTLTKSPDSGIAHVNLGQELIDKGSLDAAIREFNTALRINPDFSIAHFNLGFCLDKKGDLNQAINSYMAAIYFDPNSYGAHYKLGFALLKKGDLDAAIKEYKKAIEIKPADPRTYYSLGLVYAYKKEFNAAIIEFKKVLSISPNDIKAHIHIGLALADKGDLDAAIQKYKEAIRISPNDIDAHNSLGVTLVNKGYIDAAIHEFREVLRVSPNDINARSNIGACFAKKGDLDAAIHEFNDVLLISPNDSYAQTNLKLVISQKTMK